MLTRIWFIICVAAVFVSLVQIAVAPNASIHAGGVAQKIFYWHVSSAWVSFLGFFIAAAYGMGFLVNDKPSRSYRSFSAAEVGFMFCTIVLVTGPVWARPVWGVWWKWEPRLTTFLIMWITYASMLVVRATIVQRGFRDRVIAIYSILSFLNVPLVYASTKLWTSKSQFHPERIGLDPAFKPPLYATMAAATLLFFVLWNFRYRILKLEEKNGR